MSRTRRGRGRFSRRRKTRSRARRVKKNGDLLGFEALKEAFTKWRVT